MIPTTLTFLSISITNQQAKKYMCENCTACFDHETKAFSIFVDQIASHRNNYNSFLKVNMITSSSNTTYPKNKSSSSTNTTFINVLTRFQHKITYNRKGRQYHI